MGSMNLLDQIQITPLRQIPTTGGDIWHALKSTDDSYHGFGEAYGGEIGGEKWLSQFIGMKKDSLYKDGKEIDGITGATLSVKSFTKGIGKLSLLLPYIIDKNKTK